MEYQCNICYGKYREKPINYKPSFDEDEICFQMKCHMEDTLILLIKQRKLYDLGIGLNGENAATDNKENIYVTNYTDHLL